MRVAAGTIVAKPVLPYARVLARSFSAYHPDVPFFVLLADRVDGFFDPEAEPYRLVDLDALSRDLPLGYDQQALSYALTPSFVEHLLDRGYDVVLFLKQESLVTGSLEPVVDAVADRSVALTPHLLEPPRTRDAIARELNILVSGVFNGGVFAVRDTEVARGFLAWWHDRLRDGCRHALGDGLHWEQRWLDLVPTYFDDVAVIRDPGVNVGHWNLDERPVRISSNGSVSAGGVPCRLIRFSGFDPDRPDRLTRYNERLSLNEIGDAAEVLRWFAELLVEAGWRDTQSWPYAFA